MTIRFNEALDATRAIADELVDAGLDVVLLRDVLGRVSLFLESAPMYPRAEELASRVRAAAGPFAAGDPVRFADELFDRASVFESRDGLVLREPTDNSGRLTLLERTVVGADWTRPVADPAPNRVTLYGFKGGVGRSTATFMLAKHLARQGKCVLAIDLDLESPGLGPLAQSATDLSQHGILDHLVEDAVDNATDLELVSRSRLVDGIRNGEVWLAPALGSIQDGYLDKLNRIYADLPGRSFGDRLERAVDACEAQVAARSRRPDVVLLDSRAGIHDIAAVALTRLGDLNFLFATDNPQTWTGYRALFEQWANREHPADIGAKLKMVSAMTPANSIHYLRNFQDHAQQCFEKTLYENTDPGDLEAFNFAVRDESAPHSPLAILFNSDLVALDVTATENWHSQDLVEAAFKGFLGAAAQMITGETDE